MLQNTYLIIQFFFFFIINWLTVITLKLIYLIFNIYALYQFNFNFKKSNLFSTVFLLNLVMGVKRRKLVWKETKHFSSKFETLARCHMHEFQNHILAKKSMNKSYSCNEINV